MRISHPIYESHFGRILLVVLVILFTVCAGPANSASDPGTVTIVLEGEPPTLDPSSSPTTLVGRVLIKNVTESLTEINPDDIRVIPETCHFMETD